MRTYVQIQLDVIILYHNMVFPAVFKPHNKFNLEFRRPEI